MATKRNLDSGDSTSPTKKEHLLTPQLITTADTHATVHACVYSLSSLDNNYFEGEMTDGVAVIRIVGFDRAHFSQMELFWQKKTTVTLKNCQIKPSKFTSSLEILFRNYTTLEPSDVTFDLSNWDMLGTKLLDIAQLPTTNEYERVTVRAQVIKVADPEKVGRGLTKREVTIADSTEAAILTLWGTDIDKVELANSYQFHRVVVRTYRGKYQLSFPKCGATITPIRDLEDVMDDSFDLDDDTQLDGAQIIGVHQLETIFTCISCKKGGVKKTTSTTGTCQQCATVQKLKKEKLTCKLFIEAGDEHLMVRAYEDILTAIVEPNEITCENLLGSRPFNLKYNEYHVLTSVSRS